MFGNFLKKIVGDSNERELKGLQPLVNEINGLEAEMEQMSDIELRTVSDELMQILRDETREMQEQREILVTERQHAEERTEQDALDEEIKLADDAVFKAEARVLEEILPRAFAAVRESSRRTTRLRHFDVQLLGGVILHQGKVAEMKTGEGKTLVATLPTYLNALTGRGVHVVTVNDYLAKRDTQWMGPIYHLLGMSVGVIQHDSSFLFDPDFVSDDERYQFLRPVGRHEAYMADITYGTNNEFGFDYLRDNMAWSLEQCVQRELHYAIIDEVDNILIDEARTPLIISGMAEESSELYHRFAGLVPRLRRDEDYTVDEKSRVVVLTEQGVERMEGWLGVENLYLPEHYDMTPYLDNALRAQVIYQRDRDYIVKDGQVIIVDEFTGRLMHGRRYSEGLHQAIEAKEGVEVQRESLTLATITFQNYFRMYRKLAGMTGTAETEAEEFHKIYKLDVTVIPTHKPMIRDDMPDMVYKSEAAKYTALVKEIKRLYEEGRPVLVGTVSVENSEYLAELLTRQGVTYQVLNAKLHEKEAHVIAQAGRPGAVTIATNMAGRGVDILLGGNPEGLAREVLRKQGIDLATVEPDVWNAALAEVRIQTEADRQRVLALGGLQIIGTERHEARRIDNQLRGRAGRQGDPGASRFYLSLEDDLMRRFGGSNIAGLMDRLGVEDDMPLEHGMVSKAIENAQIKVEGYNFDIRKHVLEYDDVVNKQREVIYAERRRILQESSLRGVVLGMIGEEVDDLVESFTPSPHRDDWDLNNLWSALRGFVPVPFGPDQIDEMWGDLTPDEIKSNVADIAAQAYDAQRNDFGRTVWEQLKSSTRSLGELAASEGGLFELLRQSVRYYLDDASWQTVVEKPAGVYERELRAEVQDALGRAMALQRDRQVMIRAVDSLWIRHLTDLSGLREGIGLRAYGQQDPLVSYKKEAHDMYMDLLVGIRHEVASSVLRAGLAVQERRPAREIRVNRAEEAASKTVRRVPAKATAKEKAAQMAKVGRNDPCPCGSGKKYKHCHGR